MYFLQLGAISVLLRLSLATSVAADFEDPGYNCTRGRPCWPSASEWRDFNSSIAGNLHVTVPWAASCYRNSPYHDEATCDIIQGNYTDGMARSSIHGATEVLNWEVCRSQSCALECV
jgi:hypothetical protein